MADDLALLFRLRGENAQLKGVLADSSAATKATVAELRQLFGSQLSQSVTLASKSFSSIDSTLQTFVAQRLPLVGGAFIRVTDGLKSVATESPKTEKAIAGVAKSIESIATQSGRTVPQVASFLARFIQIEGQSKRNEAAFGLFGGSVDAAGKKTANFLPELEKAGAALAGVSAESAGAASAVAGLAGPIGIAVVAITAAVVAVISLNRAIFNLAKTSADFQGKLFDLSQQVGVSVETLSALEVVARTTGGSIDGVVASLGIFQKKLEESVEDPGSKAAQTFRRLNVETTDTEQALRQTIAALARMPEGFRQTALALELFGRGGKAVLAIAKESKGDIDAITEKLKNLGLVTSDQAKVADEFNDQLVLLDIQLRGLGTKAVPIVLDVLKDLSRTLQENRTLFNILQGIVAAFAVTIKAEFGFAKAQLEPLILTLQTTAAVVKKIREELGLISSQPPPDLPKLPEQQGDAFTKQQKEQLEGRRRLQAVLNFDFAQQQQQARAVIAQAQRDFESGKRSREDLLKATIEGINKETRAQIEALQVERRIKLEEQALAKDDLQKQSQFSNAIIGIDAQIATKRSEIREREKDERAKFRREEEANETAHQQRLLERSRELDQINIRLIEQRLALGKKSPIEGDKEIENIELTAIDREQRVLVKRLELAGKDVAKRKEIQSEIARLDNERTATEQRHSEQRIAIVTRESDVVLQLIQAKGSAIIAASQGLANARVITEEEAERRIAQIRLEALDAEIAIAQAKGQDTRLLNTQRAALQAEVERDIEAGRQRDLGNERRYADELERIRSRVRDIERDTAQETIRLMQLHFAGRKDIIRAQRDLELQEEADRHQRETDSINAQRGEVDEEIRILEARLESLRIGTTEEIEQHDRIVAALERLRLKRAELKAQQDAENERTKTRKRRVSDEADDEEEDADPLGRLRLEAADFKKVASDLESTIVPLNQILAGSFLQVADAIGQTVQNWVLLGETGPAVGRRILAQALANLAAEAAVNAIKELALGFATLFFNPAESAAHFTAAALWGSIGIGSALAGRAVAGDLFKPKSAAGGAGSGSGSSSSRDGKRDPIDLVRSQQNQELHIFLHGEPGPRFRDAVFTSVIDDVRTNGPMRSVIKEVAEG